VVSEHRRPLSLAGRAATGHGCTEDQMINQLAIPFKREAGKSGNKCRRYRWHPRILLQASEVSATRAREADGPPALNLGLCWLVKHRWRVTGRSIPLGLMIHSSVRRKRRSSQCALRSTKTIWLLKARLLHVATPSGSPHPRCRVSRRAEGRPARPFRCIKRPEGGLSNEIVGCKRDQFGGRTPLKPE
jgi:hypothetical protein